MAENTLERDVVVVGAGMAGLVAAVRATKHDASVTVLEKGSRVGGSMYLSHGYIWTYESLEAAREAIPHGNPELQGIVIDSLEDGLAWLEELGVGLKEMDIDLPKGQKMEPPQFIDVMTEILEEAGNEVRLRTPMKRLRVDDAGSICGVVATDASGETVRINADSVVLATGGFQGNEQLVERYITDHPENLWLRANPWSTGDGILEARRAGAKTTLGFGTFYGHNLLAPPAEFSPIEFGQATQYYGIHALAIDENGRRYTDESESALEESLTQDTAKKAAGRAWYIVDQDLYETDIREGRVGGIIEQAVEFGGNVIEADSLTELSELLEEAGTDGQRAVETIETFNEAIRQGTAEDLEPPREGNQRTFDTPPFYAVHVQPGITTTGGGLDVTGNMEVLDRSNTSSSLDQYPENMSEVFFTPIPGLYAAGIDVGNINHRQYMGGLSTSLVTGRIAGKHAAEHGSGS